MKSNFKIIAIKALNNCDTDFTKVLEKEKLYYFYSDYRIEENEEFEEIFFDNNYPCTLFNIQGKNTEININISAIVGKNGSGKSSIIELLLRALNNVACNYLKTPGKPLKTITANLKVVEGIDIVFYYHSDSFYKVRVNNSKVEVFKFNSRNSLLNNSKSIDSTFELSDLFYTETINYSHYAYNSLEFGFYKDREFVDWLTELFHKNDSYQTPIVLNPMRTEGFFNINRENDLVKQRLLANLLRKNVGNISFRRFGDNLEAKSIKFRLKDKKTYFSIWTNNQKGKPLEKKYDLGVYSKNERRDIINKLMKKMVDVDEFNLEILDDEIYSHAEMYIIYKITSICKKYIEYGGYFNEKGKRIPEHEVDNLINDLKLDNSHITFKLKQTLNYLKKDYINFKGTELTMSVDGLSKQINTKSRSEQFLLELIPPPIFDIEIVLENIKTKEEVQFKTLSSGEKQLIYMVSSLLYHLYNLDSVTGKKVKYKNINIILEEIELYFHPDYQKSFIKYFLDSIESIELKNIESINICVLTHSPFILSDIPSNNIMYLKVQDGRSVSLNKDDRKTFGANIHELLTDNFFMSNGFIGDFAKNKIDKTIDWLNEQLIEKRLFEKATKGDQLYMLDEEELKFHKGIISIIDEPIIRIKLCEMLSELEPNENSFYNKLVIEQIANLQAKLK